MPAGAYENPFNVVVSWRTDGAGPAFCVDSENEENARDSITWDYTKPANC
jgi:hypothetical protein